MNKKDTIYARMLSGDLSQPEIKSLKDSGEWQEIEAIINLSESLTLPEYDKETEYQKLIASNRRKQARIHRIRFYRNIGIAASFALLIVVFFLLQNRNITVSAEFASSKIHHFRDGSIVTLNDGSSIRYQKKNWKKKRHVTLEGEALFEVEKGSPFVVYTDHGKVEVLGTSFNVRCWGEKISVECYTGKVKVSSMTQEVILAKGQAIVFVNGEKEIAQNIEHSTPFWLNDVSKFWEENLNIVFDELERQYKVEVVVDKMEKAFTGSFTQQSLDEALGQICIPMGLTFVIDADKKRVTISKK